MKLIKRIALILLLFLLLAVGIIVAIPVFFKDKLVTLAKQEINATIKAKADFSDVSLSVWRTFPHIGMSLENFSIVGIDTFENVPLVNARKAAATVDLWSVLGNSEAIDIRSVELVDPNINILVLPNGTANYDIMLSEEEAAAADTLNSTDLNIALQEYSITNASIRYDDRQGDMFLDISGLDHSGSGDLTLTEYDLETTTSIDSLTYTSGLVSFLKNAKLTLDAGFHINTETSTYTLRDNRLTINELALQAEGQIQMPGEDIVLDLNFKAPDADFRDAWSLIPNAYTADYANVDIKGTFSLEGLVKGVYNEQSYPAFRIKTQASNGRVKYPDLPLPIEQINASVDINSPGADLDGMSILIEKLGLKVGSDPFNMRCKITTPISDPNVDAQIKGTINLAQWAKAFPLDGVDEMTGKIIADVDINTRMSTIEREAYDQVKMQGDLKVENIVYAAQGLPRVVVRNAAATFTPQAVQLQNFTAQLGKSDIQAAGTIDNILAYISPEKTMRGNIKASSNYFLADEWLEEEAPATAQPISTSYAAAPTTETEIFDRFDFIIDATAAKIVYDTYTLTNCALDGHIRPNKMDVANLSGNIGESDFKASGTITNAFDYAFKNGVLGGTLNLQSNFFDLNPFMVETPSTSGGSSSATVEEALEIIPVPAHIDMVVFAKMDKVKYTNFDLDNLSGKLTIANESIVLEDGIASVLGGKIAFTGLYDTQNAAEPTYSFKYDMQQMDFQKTFQTFNTFSSLAPIGEFLRGNFSNSMLLEGTIGEGMMPKLDAIDAQGVLETANGSLKGFAPLTAVGDALNLQALKGGDVQLDKFITWFTIEKGVFEVKPFDVKAGGLPMTISGKHALNQDMNYTIDTSIPRSMLGKGTLGTAANQGISQLLSEAGKLGVNINDAETVNVRIFVGGNIAKPKVTFKLMGVDGETTLAEAAEAEARQQIDQKVDEVKQEVNTRVDDARQRAEAEAQRQLDSAKVAAERKLEEAKKAAEREARERLGSVVDSLPINQQTRQRANEAADKIKGEIRDFNPFKKRDGGGGGK